MIAELEAHAITLVEQKYLLRKALLEIKIETCDGYVLKEPQAVVIWDKIDAVLEATK